jgi:predicted metalloprotease with PDZ domain
MNTQMHVILFLGLWLSVVGAEPKPKVRAESPVSLPAVAVSTARYRDYGLSLKLNPTAVFGKKITTLEVGRKVPAESPAGRAGLKTGDELLVVNGRDRATLTIKDIDSMLFDKKVGEPVDLVIKEKSTGMVRIVRLVAE